MQHDADSEDLVFGSGNIFADAGLPNADELQLKADLAVVISRMIRAAKVSQTQAADMMHITQPEVSLVLNGKLRSFSFEKLLHMAKYLGCNINITLEKSMKPIGEIHLATV